MNAESFFENFELLAESPNSIKKLREMILQTAVRGKLVPQNPEDESVEVLLEKIRAENKIQQLKNIIPISTDELPFAIAPTWKWVRFSQITDFNIGRTPNTKVSEYWSENGIPWVSIADMENYGEITGTKKSVSKKACKEVFKSKPIPAGTILMSFKLTIGKISMLKVDAFHNEAIISMFPPFNELRDYLFKILPMMALGGDTNNAIKGKTLNKTSLSNLLIPLPPLEEQKRIVAKVNQLMNLCDQLESLQQKKNKSLIQLNNSTLNKILDAGSPEEFAEYWQLMCENFDLLYDDLDNVEKLKQAILQLAVQGKLVEQDENDEPARVLLERIKVEKERLVKEKRIKKIDTLNSISSDDILFELPLGWTWVRIGDIVKKLGSGSTPKGGKSVYQDDGIKFIRSQNVRNEGLKLQNVALISLEIHKKMNGTVVYPGDILLNITGASIGRSSVVPDEFDEGNVSQHVSILRLIDNEIRKFIHTCIISPLFQEAIMDAQVGISREGLSISSLKDFLIPLPPLAEQKRIVAKVDQLMTLCNQLEAKIKQAQSDSDVLMEVSLKKVLGEG